MQTLQSLLPQFLFLFLFSLLFLPVKAEPDSIQPYIRIDQFGYLPAMEKVAVLANPQTGFNQNDQYLPGNNMEVRRWSDDLLVYSGSISSWDNGNTHEQSGDQVWWFDFSALMDTGTYYIFDAQNQVGSYAFRIAEDVYNPLMRHALRVFFYQRCGYQKQAPHVPSFWGDAICHHQNQQDLDCRWVGNPSDMSLSRDLSGGWHDAGDYNKYTNFAYEPLHDLLAAYERYPAIWTDDLNIPESGNGIPDILDEIKWELDWLLKMQLADGSGLMKVSVTDFSASSPPSADSGPRRYGGAESSATRTLCSVFAHAAVVFGSLSDPAMDIYADTLLARAEKAWNWVSANPGYSTYDNAGFSSANPERDAYHQRAMRIASAAYMYAATDQSPYKDTFDVHYTHFNPYQWTFWYPYESVYQDAMLYYCALPNATAATVQDIQSNCIQSATGNNATLLSDYQDGTDAYRASLNNNDYVWGSNEVKSQTAAIMTNIIHKNLDMSNHAQYASAAAGYLHYLHGVNPLSLVYLTHSDVAGADSFANQMYHAWFTDGSDFDDAQNSLYGPPPAYLTGGPNIYFSPSQGTISPPQFQPNQKSYLDWNTSWPENSWELTEPAIYYQAAYIKLLAHFVSEENSSTSIGDQSLPAVPPIFLYPNPASQTLQIHFEGDISEGFILALSNIQGQIIWTEHIPATHEPWQKVLDVSALAAGLYSLQAWNSRQVWQKKIQIH